MKCLLMSCRAPTVWRTGPRPAWSGASAVTDGPYLETKEYLAYAIAAGMPRADQEPVEVWAILHEAAE